LSFTKGALQQNHIHLLLKINNEAKTRRSTKSDILLKGSGIVISYKDLVAARAKRAEKDAAKAANKGKRGRKRKVTAVEALDAAVTAPVVEATALVEDGSSIPKVKGKRGRKRKSTALEAETDVEGSPLVPKGKVA
jgi:hypothetical protein